MPSSRVPNQIVAHHANIRKVKFMFVTQYLNDL